MAAETDKLTRVQPTQPELRREVPIWGSFMWGFADVGANTFVALGLVMAYAQGASGLVFALAGFVYILIGLAYTELASAFPLSGGGPYFTMRGLGDFWGFVSGSALVLDYTIDIALFATVSAGYLNFFLPSLLGTQIEHYTFSLGPFHGINWLWCGESLALILILVWVNIRGVRESSFVNEIIGIIVIASESSLVIFGLLFAWKPEFLLMQWKTQFPTLENFLYGASLCIISFVGLESISQAAQETKRPATVIPRTSIALIFSVFLFAVAFSTLGMGVLPWQVFAENIDSPMSVLAAAIPIIGAIAGPFIAGLGALVLFISSNTGVMGASRLSYSLSQYGLISPWFGQVHGKFRTPIRAILVFSGIAVMETILSFLTPSAMDTLANMYAFGASLGYTMVFIALIKLRFSDPYSPRPYLMPLNLKISHKHNVIRFPLLGVIGMLAIASIFAIVIWTHEIGRIAGISWIFLTFLYYAWFRRKSGYPLMKSLKRDWEKEQIEVLTSAEEYDLLEQYKVALGQKAKQERVQKSTKPTKGW